MNFASVYVYFISAVVVYVLIDFTPDSIPPTGNGAVPAASTTTPSSITARRKVLELLINNYRWDVVDQFKLYRRTKVSDPNLYVKAGSL